ncbi:MAG TPA: hypothetical protein VHZ55_15045 [Bryobacteraceae bacterium]|nr:hypothetical protein [Bryobacteraceae bacterium]
MSRYSAKQKSLASLLLVLVLILGICCFTTQNSSVDLLVPAFVFLFVLLVDPRHAAPAWRECAAPTLEPYTPAAPNRAPPA